MKAMNLHAVDSLVNSAIVTRALPISPTRRSTLRCGRRRNASSNPNSCISSSVEGWMVSPRKSRRKSACFSSTTTSTPARARRYASIIPAGPPPTMQHFVVSVFAPMWSPTRLELWAFLLQPRGAAVGAGIVATFQHAARMEDDGARVAHRVGVALGEHLDIMSGVQQAVDHIAVEAILHAQAGDGRAPGAT